MRQNYIARTGMRISLTDEEQNIQRKLTIRLWTPQLSCCNGEMIFGEIYTTNKSVIAINMTFLLTKKLTELLSACSQAVCN